MALFRKREADQRDARTGRGVLRRVLLLANLANRGFRRTPANARSLQFSIIITDTLATGDGVADARRTSTDGTTRKGPTDDPHQTYHQTYRNDHLSTN